MKDLLPLYPPDAGTSQVSDGTPYIRPESDIDSHGPNSDEIGWVWNPHTLSWHPNFSHLGHISPITALPPDYATDSAPVVNPVHSVQTAPILPVYYEPAGNYVHEYPPSNGKGFSPLASTSTDSIFDDLT